MIFVLKYKKVYTRCFSYKFNKDTNLGQRERKQQLQQITL